MNDPKGPICLLCKQESKWVSLGNYIGSYWFCVHCKLEEQEWLKKAKQPTVASGPYVAGQWVKCVNNIQPMVHLTVDKAYKIMVVTRNMGKQALTVVDDKGRLREFSEERFQHTLPVAPKTAATPARQGYTHISSNGMTVGMMVEAVTTSYSMGACITKGRNYTVKAINATTGAIQIADDVGNLAYFSAPKFKPAPITQGINVSNAGTGRLSTGTSHSGNSSSSPANNALSKGSRGPLTGLALTAAATIPGLQGALILKGQAYVVIDHDPINNQVFVRNDYGDSRWYPLPNFVVPSNVAPLRFANGDRIILRRGHIMPPSLATSSSPIPGKVYVVISGYSVGHSGTMIANDNGDIVAFDPTDSDFDPYP